MVSTPNFPVFIIKNLMPNRLPTLKLHAWLAHGIFPNVNTDPREVEIAQVVGIEGAFYSGR